MADRGAVTLVLSYEQHGTQTYLRHVITRKHYKNGETLVVKPKMPPRRSTVTLFYLISPVFWFGTESANYCVLITLHYMSFS